MTDTVYQIAFYGLGLNSSIILGAIGFGSPPKDGALPATFVYQTLRNLSLGNLVLSLAGLVPGYWAAFCFIDRWGRKPIQFMGFSVLTVLFLVMGAFTFAFSSLSFSSRSRHPVQCAFTDGAYIRLQASGTTR